MLCQTLFLSLALGASATQIHNVSPGIANNNIQTCVSVKENVDGAPVTIQNCGLKGDQVVCDWDVSFFSDSLAQPAGPQQIKVFGDKCLEVKDGSSVQIGICDINNRDPNQQWTSKTDSTFRWGGKPNQCLGLRDRQTWPANGTPLVVQTCAPPEWYPKQTWASRPVTHKLEEGRLYTGGSSVEDSYCMTASSEAINAPIGLAKCSSFMDIYPWGNIGWYMPALGLTNRISASRVKESTTGKCLVVSGDMKENGVTLAIGPCSTRAGKLISPRFTALATGQLQLEGTGLCVDVAGSKLADGALIQLWECAGDRASQKWSRTGS